MRRFRQWRRRVLTGIGLATLPVVIGCVPALAGRAASPGLSGGAITFGDFPGATLHGAQQSTSVSWSIASITDATGTNAGWNESLTLTQLAQYNTGAGSYVAGGYTLPTSSITVTTPPTVSSAGGGQVFTLTSVSPGTALDTGSAVRVLSTTVQGTSSSESFVFNPMTVSLSVPAIVYAATYGTDATVTLSSGP